MPKKGLQPNNDLNITIVSRSESDRLKPVRRIRCFICHREIDKEMVAFVNHSLEEVACVCREHLLEPDRKPKSAC